MRWRYRCEVERVTGKSWRRPTNRWTKKAWDASCKGVHEAISGSKGRLAKTGPESADSRVKEACRKGLAASAGRLERVAGQQRATAKLQSAHRPLHKDVERGQTDLSS